MTKLYVEMNLHNSSLEYNQFLFSGLKVSSILKRVCQYCKKTNTKRASVKIKKFYSNDSGETYTVENENGTWTYTVGRSREKHYISSLR